MLEDLREEEEKSKEINSKKDEMKSVFFHLFTG